MLKKIGVLVLMMLVMCADRPYAQMIEYPKAENSPQKYFVGEKLTYRISYMGIPVGKAESTVKEITEVSGRDAYHIEVKVKSYPIIDLVYKVRDEHHTYIDVEHLHTLRYEKILREGSYRADEVMTYDQENHTAHYLSRRNKSEKEMLIPENVQDALSCGYVFRTYDIQPNTSIFVPVNADEKNWDMEVKLHDIKQMKVKGVGKFYAIEAEPVIQYQGIFVKRGKIKGWLGLDERRVPLKMKVQVPILGSITAVLKEYVPGE